MNIVSEISDLPAQRVRELLDGLPPSEGYRVVVKPLRWRTRPHLAALTNFDDRLIVLQVPRPFLPFGEIVPYAAKRLPGDGMRFVWLTEGITLRSPREVLRYLYLHEWMHWYLREVLGRKAAAETACERFALRNYLKDAVTEADAHEALRRRRRPLTSNGFRAETLFDQTQGGGADAQVPVQVLLHAGGAQGASQGGRDRQARRGGSTGGESRR